MSANRSWVADDVEVPVVDYNRGERSVVASEVELRDLREEAVSAQRLVVSRLARRHVPGRMELAVAETGKKMVPEKMFNINKLVEWVDGDAEVVIEALDAGRLRCRLNAAMGLGKSTKLASYIARVMDYRVLHVALDAHALQQVAVYIRNNGIGKINRRWSSVKKAWVCCMTYGDFVGHMMSSRRSELYKSFDVIIFDEAFVDSSDVFVAKRCFSVYAPAETSLLLCSATMRADVDAGDVGSKSMGMFKESPTSVTLREAIDSGKLVADYLVDRTMVVLPSNDQIYAAVEHYEAFGVDVRSLDDADDFEALRAAEEWLLGDSTVPRVVVVHSSYGIGLNLPVAYEIIWPLESSYMCTDDTVSQVERAMTAEMVAQVKARTGRSIVEGSGGIVMASDRSDTTDLREDELMSAFVKMCAVSILPMRSGFWEPCYRGFPDGLTVTAAMTMLKVCMPVEVVARYLGSDGRVAARYVRALNVFSQPDHFLVASDNDMPVSYDSWVVDSMAVGGVDEAIRVPFFATGELKVIIDAVEMMAQMRIDVPRWRPSRRFAMDDGYDSEEERGDSRYKAGVARLRRIPDVVPRALEEPPRQRRIPWEYRPGGESGSDVRHGGFIDSERCRQALLEMENSLLEYHVQQRVEMSVVEETEGSVVPVVIEGLGDVESPGGTVVCSLPVKICESLNLGRTLRSDEFLKLASAARVDVEKFVGSKLFDCFSGPWESILRSLNEENVIHEVVKSGVATDVYAMVDKMRSRFSVELVSVLASSNVFKRRFLKVFSSSPSMDDMMRAIRKGKFDGVAQTDAFIDRVKLLKELIDMTLLAAESRNVYLPTYITSAQRALPLRGDGRLGYVGGGIVPMPHQTSRRLYKTIEGGVGDRDLRDTSRAR